MTQEEKDLLLRDISARLPYGVKGRVTSRDCNNRECEFVATIDGKLYDRFAVYQESWFDNVTIKPYLFPLSSMTEEQKQELYHLVEETAFQIIHSEDGSPQPHIAMDWYNKNHFDYRGLIEEGLVLNATGLNIY